MELWQKLRDDYTRYNQYVDIVACWESFLSNEFGSNASFKFLRFPPSHFTDSGKECNPDFCVIINENYGILFELKRTIGGDEDTGFKKTYDQLEKYLEKVSSVSDGTNLPENLDLVYLTSKNHSRRIERKIRNGLDYKGINSTNLIIIEYGTDQADTIFTYYFRKVNPNSPDFSDEGFDGRNPLNEVFGEENDYEGVQPPTKYFWPYRIICPIMNDDPPPVYLAALLWQNYFYRLLTEDQKEKVKTGLSHQKIRINVENLTEIVKRDFPIRKHNIRNTLKFLVEGNLAEESDKDDIDFIVRYHRIKKMEKVTTRQEKEEERLIKKYVKKYGEVPPLNSVIPRKYDKW